MSEASVASNLQLYLQEINRTPLLTAAEEAALARRILDDNCPVSRDRMIRSNLRLVVSIAKRYARVGVPLADLIEEGNLGLMRAVETFDPEMGARFSTYASWWIKQSIRRALLGMAHPVRVPAYMMELINKWKRAVAHFEREHGRAPSLQELSSNLNLPVKKLRAVRLALRVMQRSAQPIGDSDGEHRLQLADVIEDERTPMPDSAASLQDDLRLLRRLLDQINEREATILRLRYGLDGTQPLTLKEIGEQIGLTRERVRQIEIEALKKLFGRLSGDRVRSPGPYSPRRET